MSKWDRAYMVAGGFVIGAWGYEPLPAIAAGALGVALGVLVMDWVLDRVKNA